MHAPIPVDAPDPLPMSQETLRRRTSVRRSVAAWLGAPIDAASLGLFRILFGGLLFSETLLYFSGDRIGRYFIRPKYLFPYELFPWVTPWPGDWMYVHFGLVALGALGIMLGLFYRASALLFFLTYTYQFLIDKTQYNNHYYLISLLAFLLWIMPAHRWASIDRQRYGWPSVVPFWTLFLLRAQIVLVFFYAGIAKLNADWLDCEPMRTWLYTRQRQSVLGPFLASDWSAYFFSYGGLLFDLSIGFLLLWKKTRLPAVALALFFNLSNWYLFYIGVFPFLMLATIVLFFEPDWPRRLWQRFTGRDAGLAAAPRAVSTEAGPWVLAFIAVYLTFQVLFPLRHFLYPGNVSWTEDGHRFSWHMKLRDKGGKLWIWVTDPATNTTWEEDFRKDLHRRQQARVRVMPDMLLQYIGYLKKDLAQRGFPNAIIHVDAWVALNRRPLQRIVNREVNLAAVEPSLFQASWWLLPLDPSMERTPLENERLKAKFQRGSRSRMFPLDRIPAVDTRKE